MSKLTVLPENAPFVWTDTITWPDDAGLCHSMYEDDEWSLVCTGPEGHDGPHVAEGVSCSIASWEGQ